MTQITDNVWAVKIHEEANDVELCEQDYGWVIQYKANRRWHSSEVIPPGQWEFICTSKDATNEEARMIVDQQAGGGKYKNYTVSGSLAKYGTYLFYAPIESLESLLKSKGLEGNFALLRKL
jgi:hypothetical protein